jgi:two-component system sensor histidine kinase FlrB
VSLGADARSGTDATRADRAAQTLDALPAGVVVVSALGVVEACNPAARTLVGEDARGHLWRDVAARVFRPRPDDGPDLSLVDGRRVHIDTCSLRDPPGQVLLIQDVTELRGLQARIGQLERLSALGEMAAGLAHQVRTPLASALLYAGALARPAAEVPRVAGKLLGVLRQLEGLVRDMLLFARQGRFEMEDLTVGALIQGLREQLGPRLEARGVSLECRVDAPAAGLRGSPQALTGALGNLVDNACDAGARRVLLTAGPVGADRLAMDVADDGPGVPPELRERLFRPFFTTRPGGSGLGLAVARAVAEAHGGSVGLLDDSGGARFRIELPLWPQARYDGRTAAVQEGA